MPVIWNVCIPVLLLHCSLQWGHMSHIYWCSCLIWHFRGTFVAGTNRSLVWSIKSQIVDLFLFLCAVIWGQHVDHIFTAVEHACVMWQAYLFWGICQCMYIYWHLWSHCWLHWVHIRDIYWHSCLLHVHELICTYGIRGDLCFWHIFDNNVLSSCYSWLYLGRYEPTCWVFILI